METDRSAILRIPARTAMAMAISLGLGWWMTACESERKVPEEPRLSKDTVPPEPRIDFSSPLRIRWQNVSGIDSVEIGYYRDGGSSFVHFRDQTGIRWGLMMVRGSYTIVATRSDASGSHDTAHFGWGSQDEAKVFQLFRAYADTNRDLARMLDRMKRRDRMIELADGWIQSDSIAMRIARIYQEESRVQKGAAGGGGKVRYRVFSRNDSEYVVQIDDRRQGELSRERIHLDRKTGMVRELEIVMVDESGKEFARPVIGDL